MELKWVPKRRNVLTLMIDEEPIRDIHTSIFGRSPKITSLEDLASLELKGAKNCALRLLSLRAYLSTTLDRALKERLVSEETRTKVIAEMVALGYINDTAWIDQFIQIQMTKKTGPNAIYQKLRAKGLKEEVICAHLQISPDTQKEQIQSLLNTKFKSHNLDDYKEKQKVIASLLRKGFDYEQVREVLE